jgi:hypothetical protein
MVEEAFPEDVYGGCANEADEVERVRGFEHFRPAPLPRAVPRGRTGLAR